MVNKDKMRSVRYSSKKLELLKKKKQFKDLTIQKIVDEFFDKHIKIEVKPK